MLKNNGNTNSKAMKVDNENGRFIRHQRNSILFSMHAETVFYMLQ